MVEVSLDPRRLVAGAKTEMVVTVSNSGPDPCSNIVVRPVFPPSLLVISGRDRLEVESLLPGARRSFTYVLRPTSPGRFAVTTSNFSYRNGKGHPQRHDSLSLPFTVEDAPPPAYEPEPEVNVTTAGLPLDAWDFLEGSVKNPGTLTLHGLSLSATGPRGMDIQDSEQTLDDIPAGGRLSFRMAVKCPERGASVPIALHLQWRDAKGQQVGRRSTWFVRVPGHTTAGPSSSAKPVGHKYDVVLSFSGKDRATAERIFARISAHGFEIFYDEHRPEDLLGEDLAILLQDVYFSRSRYAIALVSESFLESKWAAGWEWKAILARMQSQSAAYLLPYFLENVDVPGLNPTIGRVSVDQYSPEAFADIVMRKMGRPPG